MKEIIKIRAEINDIETKKNKQTNNKTIEQINELGAGSSKKSIKFINL